MFVVERVEHNIWCIANEGGTAKPSTSHSPPIGVDIDELEHDDPKEDAKAHGALHLI